MAESQFQTHASCSTCGSRDNVGVYSDGHSWCFSCDTYISEAGEDAQPKPTNTSLVTVDKVMALPSRKLTEDTCRKWGYGVNSRLGCQVATYYDSSGAPCAQKLRFPGKEFSFVGDKKKAQLYGQQLWREGGKRLVVTEGEIDALSVSQSQGNKYAVVSIPSGAKSAAKAVKAQLEWVNKYDVVVFMFDMDEPGQAAARECADLLEPGKARIAVLPENDPSDTLVSHGHPALVDAFWSAKTYRPDGIIYGDDLYARLSETPKPGIAYPYPALTEKTGGLRSGELVVFTAGTGIGKSTICREIGFSLLDRGERLGWFGLEETVRTSLNGLLAVALNTPLHKIHEADSKERDAVWHRVRERVFFYDHWGTLDIDTILAKTRYMVKALGCRWIVIDHLSILISGLVVADERKALDVAMTKLRSLVEETQCGMLLVSHLSRPQGKERAHEEGGRVTLRHLRGSQAIPQLADIVVAIERNQQDPTSTTADLRVLKNRWSGLTGPADSLVYEVKTGRLLEAGASAFI